ncbi:hypothetical protein F511_19022 [Dorcoceras hygrometricum]|uniref:Uncharacterized protein n=1 Tax=Dorcoceras hygrometricum TaxID=472368 RepID=A0A2Z7BU55_9LAMI|nr:hypothetical protein F511_19022 [Dorcoceras hygrometricum]
MDRIRRTVGDSTVEVLLPHKIGIVAAGHEVIKACLSYGCVDEIRVDQNENCET